MERRTQIPLPSLPAVLERLPPQREKIRALSRPCRISSPAAALPSSGDDRPEIRVLVSADSRWFGSSARRTPAARKPVQIAPLPAYPAAAVRRAILRLGHFPSATLRAARCSLAAPVRIQTTFPPQSKSPR